MPENRVYFYDLVKCIASYLICLSHFGTLDTDIIRNPEYQVYFNYFFKSIASVGVPIFLMVNGSFLLNKNYPLSKILHRAKSFTILYFVWGAITLLILSPLFKDHYTVNSFFFAIVNLKAGRTNHLWFMMAMIYIYLLLPFVKALYEKSERTYTIYLLVVIFLCTFGFALVNDIANALGYLLHSMTLKHLVLKNILWFNPFNPWFAFVLVYFVCGGLISKHLQRFNFKSHVLLLCMLLSLVLLFLFGIMKTHIDTVVYDSVWGGHETIMTLIMSISLFLLCSKIRLENKRIIEISKTIGVNTLGIYFVHMPLGFWLTGYYYRLAISHYFLSDLLYAFFLWMLSFFISLALKQIPFVNKLVKI